MFQQGTNLKHNKIEALQGPKSANESNIFPVCGLGKAKEVLQTELSFKSI
jgi:hypothetical protein